MAEQQTSQQPAQPAIPPASSGQERATFVGKLRAGTLACRLRHEKLGVRKALSREQLREAADHFDADSKALSAAKKLLDTRDPAYRAVIKVRSRATQYWKSLTAPFPEPGIRLIRRDAVAAFDQKMRDFRAELTEAAAQLQAKYFELRQRAEEKLGALYCPTDYPLRIDTEFAIEWDYPSIEPPSYLKDLHPHLYEQEQERIRARFEEALRLTEQTMLTKLHEMVTHLAERLRGSTDGKPRVFRDSAVENLNALFDAFRQLDVGSSEELANLMTQAQQAVAGVTPDDLRGSQDLRQRVADQLGQITQQLDGMMVNRPRRAFFLADGTDTGAAPAAGQPAGPPAGPPAQTPAAQTPAAQTPPAQTPAGVGEEAA